MNQTERAGMRRHPETVHIVPGAGNDPANVAPGCHEMAYVTASWPRSWRAISNEAVPAPAIFRGGVGSANTSPSKRGV